MVEAMRSYFRLPVWLVSVVVAGLLVSGCSDDPETATPETTTTVRPPDETTTTMSGPVLDSEAQTRLLTAANRMERAWLLGRRFPPPDDLFASCENVLSPEVSLECTDAGVYAPLSDAGGKVVGVEVSGKMAVAVTEADDESWWCIGTLGEDATERVWGSGQDAEAAAAACPASS